MDEFQPNIESLNIRTQAMLAMARPCDVLAMLEAAHDALERPMHRNSGSDAAPEGWLLSIEQAHSADFLDYDAPVPDVPR